jgi:hypothetical protein
MYETVNCTTKPAIRNNNLRGVMLIDGYGGEIAAYGVLRNKLNGWVFGPTFDSVADAEGFIEWLWHTYQREADDMAGTLLMDYYEHYKRLVRTVSQSLKMVKHCVIVCKGIGEIGLFKSDEACTRQVAVIRAVYLCDESQAEIAKAAGTDNEVCLESYQIADNDLVVVEYVARNAEIGPDLVDVGGRLTHTDRQRFVLGKHVNPIDHWSIQLQVVGNQLKYVPIHFGFTGWRHEHALGEGNPVRLVENFEELLDFNCDEVCFPGENVRYSGSRDTENCKETGICVSNGPAKVDLGMRQVDLDAAEYLSTVETTRIDRGEFALDGVNDTVVTDGEAESRPFNHLADLPIGTASEVVADLQVTQPESQPVQHEQPPANQVEQPPSSGGFGLLPHEF